MSAKETIYGFTLTHAQIVERYKVPGVCCVEVTDWPYECKAKDKNPDATVYTCSTHSVWWTE